jgi:carboxypeptidase Taq
MDGYQPGVTAAEVEPVFTAYEAFLADALPAPRNCKPAAPRRRAAGPFPAPRSAPVPAPVGARSASTTPTPA